MACCTSSGATTSCQRLDGQPERRATASDALHRADGGSADDPFAGIQKENAELSARLLETRAELAQERARADAATQELVRLQLERDVGLRQLVGGPQDQQQTEGPYPARQHLSVRDLVVENTSLRAAATSLEQQLLAAKLELALTQEELDRRTL